MNTEIQNICCPSCGATVIQTVRHNGFQAGGTSIGPSSIPCPHCATWVLSGQSEWNEMGVLQKSWFVLTRLAWIGIGCIVIGGLISLMAGWAIVETRFAPPAERSHWVVAVFVLNSLLISGIMIRNMRREISDSQLRSSQPADAPDSDDEKIHLIFKDGEIVRVIGLQTLPTEHPHCDL